MNQSRCNRWCRTVCRPACSAWVQALAVAALLLAVAGCGIPRANGPADTYGLDFRMPPGAKVHGAIVFLVDGVSAQVFNEMLEAGELPAIKKYFVDRGLYAPRAIASTPTVTLANLTSVVTGQFPGHHNITGINWFDRNTLIWRDYGTVAQKNKLDDDYNVPNIYEQFPEEMTWSLFFQPHRGCTKFVEDAITGVGPYLFDWFELLDRLTLSRFDRLADISRQVGRFPAITTVYLLAPDFNAYEHGASSPHYRAALAHTDRQIGRVLGDLQRAGLLDKLYIALVSDHGHLDVNRHMPLERFLEQKVGLDLDRAHWWERLPFETRLKRYDSEFAVPYGSGDRYFAVCLRAPRGDGPPQQWLPWLERPTVEDLHHYPTFLHRDPFRKGQPKRTVDLLDTLVKLDAVDAVAYRRGADAVRILRENGEVEFTQEGGREAAITYHLIRGEDPLGWKGKVDAAVLDGSKPMTSRQWLNATLPTDYPDLPAQILAYFRSRRAGDIVIFAQPGWDFDTFRRSGHGGIRPDDMQVPMAIAGPGVPHRRLDVARTVDLAPTILTLMGKQPPAPMDGESLVRPER